MGNGGEGKGDGNEAGINGEETAIEPLSPSLSPKMYRGVSESWARGKKMGGHGGSELIGKGEATQA